MRNPFKKIVYLTHMRFAGGPVVFAKPRFPWMFCYRPVNMLVVVYYLFPFNYLVRWFRVARYHAILGFYKLIIKIIRRFQLYVPRPQNTSQS